MRAKRLFVRAMPRPGEAALFVAGVAVSVALVSTAQTMAASAVSSLDGCPPDCPLCTAANDALNKKIQMIGMTSPDPGKYFSAGSADSCLGDLSVANLDLSRLIPDPIGLMTDAVTTAIDKLKEMAINKSCSAVRGAVGDVIGKYNNAINSVNGLNGGAIVGNLIDSKIGDISRQAMDGYAMNWQTRPGAAPNPLVDIKAPTVAMPRVQITQGAATGSPLPATVPVPAQTQQSVTTTQTTGGAVFGR